MKKLRTIISGFQLFIFLIVNVKKDEQIIVYHSPGIIKIVSLAKKIKKFKIIAEVEEIYSKVWEECNKKRTYEKELGYLNNADKYILSTETTGYLFPDKEKIVLYGSYNFVNYKPRIKDYANIDVVYAGTIDNVRKAAENAVLCTNYLPDNYRMHILGNGNEIDTLSLIKQITAINNKKNYKCCTYHGLKKGEELYNLMSSFDIGLNSQVTGTYMDTAFPSKILFYLSCNLRVVSTEIINIKKSIINKYINFSKNDTPQEVAKTITSLNMLENKDTKEALMELDYNFSLELKRLIEMQ